MAKTSRSAVRSRLLALPNWAPFVGAGISVVLGIVVTVIADEKALLGLLVGLIGTMLALQVDALARFERRADREDRLARILRDIDDQVWALDEFQSIAKAVDEIRGSDFLIGAARGALKQTSGLFSHAARGDWHSEVDYSDLMTLVHGTTTSIRATSLARSERDFWNGRGREYWRANVKAMMERNVCVERVFVYSGPDPELDEVCQMQAAAGVKVYTVEEAKLPPELVEHLLILDDAWSQEILLDIASKPRKYVYRSGDHEVQTALRRFGRIRDEFADRLLPPAADAVTARRDSSAAGDRDV